MFSSSQQGFSVSSDSNSVQSFSPIKNGSALCYFNLSFAILWSLALIGQQPIVKSLPQTELNLNRSGRNCLLGHGKHLAGKKEKQQEPEFLNF
jgi:hypothetical protein